MQILSFTLPYLKNTWPFWPYFLLSEKRHFISRFPHVSPSPSPTQPYFRPSGNSKSLKHMQLPPTFVHTILFPGMYSPPHPHPDISSYSLKSSPSINSSERRCQAFPGLPRKSLLLSPVCYHSLNLDYTYSVALI